MAAAEQLQAELAGMDDLVGRVLSGAEPTPRELTIQEKRYYADVRQEFWNEWHEARTVAELEHAKAGYADLLQRLLEAPAGLGGLVVAIGLLWLISQ
jgi:hypothetical protein